MPSFWPFGRDDTSAASFEKVLSQLSAKITKTTAQNDKLRQSQRRLKVLWTLYASFAYILVALILVLVTRIDNWNAYEYSAVAGGPVLIYVVRTGLDAWYNYRIARKQDYLNDLSRQREDKIERLKKATKYDSTQQLLDKYGGGSPGSGKSGKRQPSPNPKKGRKSDGAGQAGVGASPPGPRTGFAPPPTANIPGRQPPPPPPQLAADGPTGNLSRPPSAIAPPNAAGAPGEEFAPNAFSQPPPPPPVQQAASTQYAAPEGPKWYDRILDVVLGEDETSAKNRIVLICQECRLVNGQAPPGARTLEEVGKWRCSGCRALNGVESVEKKMLREAGIGSPTSPTSAVAEPDSEEAAEEDDASEEDTAQVTTDGAAADAPPAGSTRSKARQRKKA